MRGEEGSESLRVLDIDRNKWHTEMGSGGFKEISGYECWRLVMRLVLLVTKLVAMSIGD